MKNQVFWLTIKRGKWEETSLGASNCLLCSNFKLTWCNTEWNKQQHWWNWIECWTNWQAMGRSEWTFITNHHIFYCKHNILIDCCLCNYLDKRWNCIQPNISSSFPGNHWLEANFLQLYIIKNNNPLQKLKVTKVKKYKTWDFKF